jgi:hypothetical protein
MSVCIPTYMLASGLIAEGMNWIQAILTILLGNLIVLIPMLLNAHAGTKYGTPFPVFVRAPSVSVAPTFRPSFALSSLAAGLAFRPGSVVRPFIPCSAFSGRPPRTSTARPGSVSFFSGASIAQPLDVNFVNVAKEAGLNTKTIFGGEHKNKYLLETTGCGVALYDYDNDGWLDIFLVNGTRLEGFPAGQEPTNRLYKNNRDGTFTDVTTQAGLVHFGWGQAVCVGDYDNDGFDDLFITFFGKNVLYRNNGNGTFHRCYRQGRRRHRRQALEHRLRVRRLRSRWQA